jgi:hypothetical protein
MKCRYIGDEIDDIHSVTHRLLQDNFEMMKVLKEQQEQIQKFIKLQTTTSGFLKGIEADIN